MTTEEFWKIYINRDNILTKFDITYDFFSRELPKEFEKTMMWAKLFWKQ